MAAAEAERAFMRLSFPPLPSVSHGGVSALVHHAIRISGTDLTPLWNLAFPALLGIYWYFYDHCRSQTISNMYIDDRYGVVMFYFLFTVLSLYYAVVNISQYFQYHRTQLTVRAKDTVGASTTLAEGAPASPTTPTGTGFFPHLDRMQKNYVTLFFLCTFIRLICITAIFSNHTGYSTYQPTLCDGSPDQTWKKKDADDPRHGVIHRSFVTLLALTSVVTVEVYAAIRRDGRSFKTIRYIIVGVAGLVFLLINSTSVLWPVDQSSFWKNITSFISETTLLQVSIFL